jgi:hypothetical protein
MPSSVSTRSQSPRTSAIRTWSPGWKVKIDCAVSRGRA